jgi:hypothetical protein
MDGIVADRLMYKEDEFLSDRIDTAGCTAVIEPFAQGDMTSTLMQGIDPYLRDFVASYLSTVFARYPRLIADNVQKTAGLSDEQKRLLRKELARDSRRLFRDWEKSLDSYQERYYVDPVMDIVKMVPKEDLAIMAETLVNLTIFKKRVTEVESVGGPIDVALISKGDGFIWIKRKHYFRPELNPQFFQRYHNEVEHDH